MKDKAVVRLFVATFLVICCLYALLITCAETRAQVTWESQPINVVPQLKSAGFTPEQVQALLAAFGQVNVTATNSQRQQDETIRSLRDTVYGITPGGATGGDTLPCYDTLNTGYVEQCTYDASGEEGFSATTDKVKLNTYALQLQYDTPNFDPSPDPLSTTPVIRFLTNLSDTVELSTDYWITDQNDDDDPKKRMRYIIPATRLSGNNQMVFSAGSTNGTTNGEVAEEFAGYLYPVRGLVQSGRQSANIEEDRDTVVFASKLSDTASGYDNAKLTYSAAGETGGYRYEAAQLYQVFLSWGVNSDAYAGDSLWVESQNDSSFVIGIKWSSSARTFQWMTHGYRHPNHNAVNY